MFSKKIENSEVVKIVRTCKDNTADGQDKVTIKLIKCIIELIANTLVYNLSKQQGVFPENLKEAIIKPLLKGGNCEIIFNF